MVVAFLLTLSKPPGIYIQTTEDLQRKIDGNTENKPKKWFFPCKVQKWGEDGIGQKHRNKKIRGTKYLLHPLCFNLFYPSAGVLRCFG